MTKQRILSCFLVACVFFVLEDRQLKAQATQPTTQPGSQPATAAPQASAPLQGPAASATQTAPATAAPLPSVYGNPFNPSSNQANTTGSAQGGSANNQAAISNDDPCSALPNASGSIAFEPEPLGMAPGGGSDSL